MTYCLGHEEFVSALALIDHDTLLSGGGDGKLILWSYRRQGDIKLVCDLNEPEEADSMRQQLPCNNMRKKSRFPIKCLTVDVSRSYVAVTFYNQPLIYLLKIGRNSELDGDNAANWLEVIEKRTLDAEPIWIHFDAAHSHFLWSIGGSDSCSVQLYEIKQDKLEAAQCSIPVIERLNTSRRLVEAIAKQRAEKLVENLFKHHYNNVETYYQRKKQRIENEYGGGNVNK